MREVSLFEHNEIAYEKLCKMLNSNKCATINHATGTGKSFIALKYLFEHRDELDELDKTLAEQLHRSYMKVKNITPEKNMEINHESFTYKW